MKTIATLITMLLIEVLSAQGNSLKVQADDTYYYPPNLKFEVMNDKGETLFTEENLSQDNPIQLEGNYKVTIYTTWGDGEDTFDVNESLEIALEENKSYDCSNCSTGSSYSKSCEYSYDKWCDKKVELVDADFEKSNQYGFNTIIEFENDIFFNYIDGDVTITQNGKELELVGKYVAKTSEGYLKISYNPDSKKYWYVFTDTYNKLVYK